jgi:hypothetical protein
VQARTGCRADAGYGGNDECACAKCLKIGKVEIDQPKGSGLRYAVGTLKNDSDHSRYGITIELTLLDKNNQPLPTKASDYLQMLEPRKEWRFRALVVDSKAVSVKVNSVREEE